MGKKPLRVSTPPYTINLIAGDAPIMVLDGHLWELMSRLHAPSAQEIREMLKSLRAGLRWSRTTMAAFLGTSQENVRRWEDGTRNPSGAARRLIWLIATLVGDPSRITTGLDLMIWGQGREIKEFMKEFGMLVDTDSSDKPET